jgi:hypothetical protein
MLAHGEGAHIVSTSSSAGIVAGTLGVYATAKFAVVGMMESLRTEVEGRNIGVSVFCPGLVRSSIFNIERNRPASHGGAREPFKPPPLKPGAPPIDIMAVAMDPLETGRLVLEGVRRNDLYILTHPEFKPAVRERVRLMLASFSKLPVPAGRRIATQAITPDIYAAELAKKGLLKRRKSARTKAAPRQGPAKGKATRRKGPSKSRPARRKARRRPARGR